MKEVTDPKTGAILFKEEKTPTDIRMSELESCVRELRLEVKSLKEIVSKLLEK